MGAGRFTLGFACAGLLAALCACSPAGTAVGVAATAGTTAAQERPISKAVSDTAIRSEINYKWGKHDLALYRKVSLSVIEGRVVLTGSVINPQTRIDAARLAWQANGVKEVINEIQVENWSGVSDRARDEWIQAKIKGRLTLDSGVMSINYTVDCVNGTVYLMGIAQSQDELDRVINHVRDTAYVRSVVSYVRLKDDPARKT
ncbi:MAG: BON domain-containing protein [Alphaproteobacteria bacterium]